MIKKIGYTIGRFNPHHLGHDFLINQMIEQNDFSVILVGSSNISRTKNNPFTYIERAGILNSLYPNTIILPLNDFNNEELWINEVDKKIKECQSIFNLQHAEINLYTGGVSKGVDSQLRKTWADSIGHNTVLVDFSINCSIVDVLSATKIRNHFYNEEMEILKPFITKNVFDFLNLFSTLNDFKILSKK